MPRKTVNIHLEKIINAKCVQVRNGTCRTRNEIIFLKKHYRYVAISILIFFTFFLSLNIYKKRDQERILLLKLCIILCWL